jgi:hypothetical protein
VKWRKTMQKDSWKSESEAPEFKLSQKILKEIQVIFLKAELRQRQERAKTERKH